MSDESLSSELSLSPPGQRVAASQSLTILVGLAIGVTVFFILGYNHVLPPGRIDWLLRPSATDAYFDPSTEFLGWHFFRRAPWTLPLGLNRTYGMEFGGSIVFSDSIPLLAILFKPFSPLMGTNFQYIGIWILICFLMQGVFGALLASIFTKRIELKAIIAAFFALSPILLERGLTEYPLMGHWLILWALYLYFQQRTGRIRWTWMVIALLAATTSFYFVPMVLIIWMADTLKTLIWRWRSVGWLILEGTAVLATVLSAMWLAGYFVISVTDAGTDNFGQFATNLLGPIDSAGRSLIMTAQPHGPMWRGEGFCYLGFGIIVLAAMAVHELLRGPAQWRRLLPILPLAAGVLGLIVFSLSNQVAWGTHVLIYPDFWGSIGRMFRSSARMCWPGYYAAWLGIFYLATRGLKSWRAAILLAAMLAVQVADYSQEYSNMQRIYRNRDAWKMPLTSPFWNLAMQKYRQIVVVPSGRAYPFVPVAYLAANHNLPTNGVYVNRYPGGSVIGPISDARLNALRENRPDRDTLYIIPEPDRFAQLAKGLSKTHGVGVINGYNVIAPYWFAADEPADGLTPGGSN